MNDDIPEYICTVCGLPSVRQSMGGVGICPACDCGHFRDTTRWSYGDVMLIVRDASPEQKAEFHKRALARQAGPIKYDITKHLEMQDAMMKLHNKEHES